MSDPVDGQPIPAPSTSASERISLRKGKLDSILSASAQIFANDGYAKFSSRRVAAAAGIRLSTLQHYFGSRDNLLLATVNATMGGYVELYEAFLEQGHSAARVRLEGLLDRLIGDIQKPEICAFLFQAWALAAQDESVARLLEDQYSRYLDVVAKLVRQANPGLSRQDAHVLATMIASQLEGLMVFLYRAGSHLQPLPALFTRTKSVWLGQCLAGA